MQIDIPVTDLWLISTYILRCGTMFDVEQNLKLFVQIHEELISAASPKSVTDFCRTIWEFS